MINKLMRSALIVPFVFGFSNAAQAQSSDVEIAAHCGAPTGDVVSHISGLIDLDSYVSSWGPGFQTGYVTDSALWFGNGAALELSANAATSLNPAATDACQSILYGTATPAELDTVRRAVENDQLWWPVESESDDGGVMRGFVTARYVAFSNFAIWEREFGAAIGMTSTNHSAANRIVEITGVDTANARFYADRPAHSVVSYCHTGHGLSSLYRDGRDGVLDDEPLDKGIWTGCRGEAETPEFVERTANCTTREFLGNVVDANSVIYPGGAGAVMGDFITLCPETSKRMLREACAAGDATSCQATNRGVHSSVCAPGEDVVFSCRIADRTQSVSICRNWGEMAYVYGDTAAKPELRITQATQSIADLRPPYQFTNGAYLYSVSTGWENEEQTYSGIDVYQNGEVISMLNCAAQ